MSTGMGMVDVMHEMREMEHRMRKHLSELQSKVQYMVEDTVQNMVANPRQIEMFANEFKYTVAKMSDMMAQAADRFEVLGQLSMKANEDMHQRISNLELFLADRLDIIEYQLKSQQKNTPKPNV